MFIILPPNPVPFAAPQLINAVSVMLLPTRAFRLLSSKDASCRNPANPSSSTPRCSQISLSYVDLLIRFVRLSMSFGANGLSLSRGTLPIPLKLDFPHAPSYPLKGLFTYPLPDVYLQAASCSSFEAVLYISSALSLNLFTELLDVLHHIALSFLSLV